MTSTDPKPEMTFEQFIWEDRAVEHRRGRCAECLAGGCISKGVQEKWHGDDQQA